MVPSHHTLHSQPTLSIHRAHATYARPTNNPSLFLSAPSLVFMRLDILHPPTLSVSIFTRHVAITLLVPSMLHHNKNQRMNERPYRARVLFLGVARDVRHLCRRHFWLFSLVSRGFSPSCSGGCARSTWTQVAPSYNTRVAGSTDSYRLEGQVHTINRLQSHNYCSQIRIALCLLNQ